MHVRSGSKLSKGIGLSWIPLCAILLGCPEIRVYQSPNNSGAPAFGMAPIAIDPGESADVNIFIDRIPAPVDGMPSMDVASAPPGSACSGQSDAPGDEICQWLVEVVADDGLTLTAFDGGPDVEFFLDPQQRFLRATGGNAIDPGLTAERIGTLKVQSDGSSAGGRVSVMGQYVRASLALDPIPKRALLLVNTPDPAPAPDPVAMNEPTTAP